MTRSIVFIAFALVLSLVWADNDDFDLSSVMTDSQEAAAEKQSLKVNDQINGINGISGGNHPAPEDSEGFMRLFFTATPSPSTSPTPSITPSPSVTPTPSTTPSPSVTPTVTPTPSNSPAPSVSKSPSPTPFADGSSKIINGEQVILVAEVESEITDFATDENDEDAEVEAPVVASNVAVDDDVEITSIEAGGDFGSPTARLAVEDDLMLNGVARQSSFCGLRMFFGDGFFPIVPDSCTISAIQIPVVSAKLKYNPIKNQLVVKFKVVAFYCVGSIQCGGLRVRFAVYRPVGRKLPPANPSEAPETD